MKHCSNCGMDFEGNFCPNCGMAAQEPPKCPNCGAEIKGNFCVNCGYSVHGKRRAGEAHDWSKLKNGAATVLAFVKKYWVWLLIGVLALVAFLTLMITLVGLRGIYVDVNNPDYYYDFDATSYRASSVSLYGIDELEQGTWKLSGNKLTLTIKDKDLGKISNDLDFEKLDGFKRIKIHGREYKRVSLVGIKTKKLKIKFDAQGGNGGVTKKLQIGSRLPSLEDWGIDPKNNNYGFLGWYSQPNGQGNRYEEGERLWENRTYYACWCKNHTSDVYESDVHTHWQVCDICGLTFNNNSHDIKWIVVQPATCTEEGLEAYQCECGYQNNYYETRSISATGHSYGEWIEDSVATCMAKAHHHKECANCDYFFEEDYGDFAPHSWNKSTNKCDVCGIDKPPYDERDGKIYFGEYPQTKETDNGITATLAQMSGNRPVRGNSGEWTDYGYYINRSTSEYMWYIDLEYGGERYRGVYFTSYRPYYTTTSSSTGNTYQDDNGYYTNTLYWFKWEPIEWRVLERTDGEAFLMSNVILDSQQYYNNNNGNRTIDGKTVYPNNYKESDIRAWLNGTFYNQAFDELDQGIIKMTLVDNSASTTNSSSNSHACENTNDKVFLLSYKDVLNTSYGFNSSSGNYDTARLLKTTGYAQSQGAYTSTDSSYRGNGWWWLRSPNSDYSSYALRVSYRGSAGDSNDVNSTYSGVVPALRITL